MCRREYVCLRMNRYDGLRLRQFMNSRDYLPHGILCMIETCSWEVSYNSVKLERANLDIGTSNFDSTFAYNVPIDDVHELQEFQLLLFGNAKVVRLSRKCVILD